MRAITLIGMGRVGTHLLRALKGNHIHIDEIVTRKTDDRIRLAQKYNVRIIEDFSGINPKNDIYILAVPDIAIDSAAKELSNEIGDDALVVHTSGSTPLNVLGQYFSRYGLFYPLQSFSLHSEVRWEGLPIFIEASSPDDLEKLRGLGKTLSGNVVRIEEKQRPYLHLAAVIANNFSNALFNWSKEILDEQGLSFKYLHPLIKDGLEKSLKIGPENAQTGPAQRSDINTIKKHLELLENKPEERELYLMLSRFINPEI